MNYSTFKLRIKKARSLSVLFSFYYTLFACQQFGDEFLVVGGDFGVDFVVEVAIVTVYKVNLEYGHNAEPLVKVFVVDYFCIVSN